MSQKQQQRGAAILIAMLVVTLVATLAAGLQWRQWRLLQAEASARAQSQAAWVLVGALDWARLILREDVVASINTGLVDHLGEPWSVPLQEAKLSSFLSADSLQNAPLDPRSEAVFLSGQITDAQSKLNLTNLISNASGQAELSKGVLTSLTRLYQTLNLPQTELQNWTAKWLAKGSQDVALRPVRIEQLIWLGVSPASVAALKNHLTILPKRTPINLNTASPEVIFAALPGIEMAAAQKLVRARAQSPLQKTSDASNIMGLGLNLSDTDFSVYTQYFEVFGQLRLADWVVAEVSLVHRDGTNITTVWRIKR